MGIFDFLKKKSGAAASKQTVYMEKDNVGTRHASMSQAVAYWMGERPHLSVKPQFTMYDFPSADAAEEAMLELPFIHKAADSGKLICDRLMTFGYYAVTSNGVPTGEYEAVVIGSDLTLTEYNKAEEAFARHGGKCKNHSAPDASVKAMSANGNKLRVHFKEMTKGNDGISVYEVYTGPDKASAIAFLKDKPVTCEFNYVVVDTPEGSFGRDINGFYQE